MNPREVIPGYGRIEGVCWLAFVGSIICAIAIIWS